MTGSIEWDKDPQVSRQRMADAIGQLFIHAGQSIRGENAQDNLDPPGTFSILQEIDGWDVRFVLLLHPHEEKQDG